MTLGLFAFCVVYYLLGGLAIGVGLHRMLTHRALILPRWLSYPFVTLSIPAGTPIQWAGNHRFHHAHTDVAEDPHSPHISGLGYAHVGWYIGTSNTMLCGAYALAGPMRTLFDSIWRPRTNQQYTRLAKDVARDPYYAWLSKPTPYMLMMWLHLMIVYGAAYAIAGWAGCAFMYAVQVLMYNICDAINSVGHLLGTQPYSDAHRARNHWALGIVTLGEGWHANHHSFPTSAKHGLLKGQFDWTWQTIRLLRYLGLATQVHVPEDSSIQKKVRV